MTSSKENSINVIVNKPVVTLPDCPALFSLPVLMMMMRPSISALTGLEIGTGRVEAGPVPAADAIAALAHLLEALVPPDDDPARHPSAKE